MVVDAQRERPGGAVVPTPTAPDRGSRFLRGDLTMKMSSVAIAVCLSGLVVAGPGKARAVIIGFDNGANFTVNNTGPAATISNGVLTLTNNNLGEAHTVFYNTPQDDRNFIANFTYQASGNKSADGVAFVLQNDPRGVNALGFGGAGLGYFGITP